MSPRATAPSWTRATRNVLGLTAGNGDAYTLDGTNTWVVADRAHGEAIVVDPGPGDQAHLMAILQCLEFHSLRVSAIVLTHGHDDHSDLAPALQSAAGAPVFARDPEFCIDAPPLNHLQTLHAGTLR